MIFDFDGLLVDTERLARESWRRTEEELGWGLDPTFVRSVVGLRVPEIHARLETHVGPERGREAWERAQHHFHRLLDEGPPQVLPGAFELLDALDVWGVPRALATSSLRPRFERKVRGTGVRERFAHIVCGDEVPRGKPEPDIFLHAAALLGVPPGGCFVLEDSGPGIEAAHRAGMRPLLVPDHHEPDAATLERAEAVLADLRAALPYVAARLHAVS